MELKPNFLAFLRSPIVADKRFVMFGERHDSLESARISSSQDFHRTLVAINKPFLFTEEKTKHLRRYTIAQRHIPLLSHMARWLVKFEITYNRMWVMDHSPIIPRHIAALKNARKNGIRIVPSDVRKAISVFRHQMNSLKLQPFMKFYTDNKEAIETHLQKTSDNPAERIHILVACMAEASDDYTGSDKITGQQIKTFAGHAGGAIFYGMAHVNKRMIKGLGGEQDVCCVLLFDNAAQAKYDLMIRRMDGSKNVVVYLHDEDKILNPDNYPNEWKALFQKVDETYAFLKSLGMQEYAKPPTRIRRIKNRPLRAVIRP